MPEHEGTDMHESTGTPLTPEQRRSRTHALDRVRIIAASLDAAVREVADTTARRDTAIEQAIAEGVDPVDVHQAAGIL